MSASSPFQRTAYMPLRSHIPTICNRAPTASAAQQVKSCHYYSYSRYGANCRYRDYGLCARLM